MKIEGKIIAIVLAAGQGSRMKSDIQKQYMLLNEKPVLYYSLSTFEKSIVDEIVLVVGEGEIEYCRNEIIKEYNFTKVKTIVEGGKERWNSVYNGLSVLEACDYVLIHDGARPFVTVDMIERSIESVKTHKACVVGMPVKDTIKIADENGFCDYTPNRSRTWMIQTPQTFEFSLIKEAYDKLKQEGRKDSIITDDAMVVEHYVNCPVFLLEGSYENIKITTSEDIKIANILVGN